MSTRIPSRSRWFGLAASSVLVVAIGATACSSGSTATAPRSIVLTTTTRSGPPTVRVLGDGMASAALPSVVAVLGATDSIDRTRPGSSAVSWLDLRDPAAPDEGANHAALETTVREAPSFVLLSLGAVSSAGSVDPLLRQRVMAVVFDVLAHTLDTRVVVVGSGATAGTAGAAVDGQQADAVAAVAEAGASWADRVVWAPSPGAVVDVLRERDWI